jgi:hypothetical protein
MPDWAISTAVVTKVRLTMRHGRRRRILLEADTKQSPMAIYDFLKELAPPVYYVTQVTIKVSFETKPGKRAQTRTFSITYPNSCSLNHEGTDGTIRAMLAASGIEPRGLQAHDDADPK